MHKGIRPPPPFSKMHDATWWGAGGAKDWDRPACSGQTGDQTDK